MYAMVNKKQTLFRILKMKVIKLLINHSFINQDYCYAL